MHTKQVLLVEDNPNDVELTLRAFKNNNVVNDIIVVGDGAEALDYLFGTGDYASRDTGIIPALILLDLKLPKIDGMQVLKRIREDERTRQVPVVIFSSSRDEKDIAESYRLGVNSYVCKPVVFDRFMEAVQELAVYWLLHNEPVPNTG